MVATTAKITVYQKPIGTVGFTEGKVVRMILLTLFLTFQKGFGRGNDLKTDLLSNDTFQQIPFIIRKTYGEITLNSVTLFNKVQEKFCRKIHLWIYYLVAENVLKREHNLCGVQIGVQRYAKKMDEV